MIRARASVVLSTASALLVDVKYGWRFLRRHPGFTAVATGTLAIGLGMSTAIFGAEYAIALKPLPYPRADRMVSVEVFDPRVSGSRTPGLNPLLANAVLARPELFKAVGASLAITATTHGAAGPDLVSGDWVSGDFFATYGVPPILGRPIREADTRPGAQRVVVLSHRLWQEMFGGEKAVVGRAIDLAVSPAFMFTPFAQPTQPYLIVGVMPPLDRFPIDDALWVPLVQWTPDPRMKGMGGPPAVHGNVRVTARLEDGRDIARARDDLRSVLADWRRANPGADDAWQVDVSSLREASVPRYAEAILLLSAAVNAVLLLACISLGGMLAARTRARRTEIAIREALGADRRRIIRQLLVESSMLAVAGGVLGLAIAAVCQRTIRAIAPASMSQLRSASLDVPVVAYAAVLCITGGLAIGIWPALGLWRGGRPTALRLADGTGAIAGVRSRSRRWLVAAQVALVFPLVAGAMLAVRSFDRLVNVNVGFSRDHVLVMSLKLSASACAPRRFDACLDTIRALVDRTRALPGVVAASVSNTRPFEIPMSTPVATDVPPDGDARSALAQSLYVTPDYFRTMAIPVRAGREFSDRDGTDAPLVAVVNETFARQFLGGRAVGRKMQFASGGRSWMDVIGVVGDANDRRLDSPPTPAFYVPLAQSRFVAWTTLLVRTAVEPARLAGPARAVVAAIDPGAPVTNVSTLDRDIDVSAAEPRLNTALLATFAVFGLIVALLGVYGLVAYSVGERHREFGVRRAVGASSFDLMRLVFGEGVVAVGGGLGVGMALASAAGRWYRSQLFDVSPNDPSTLAGVALLIVLVAALAYGLPARRAVQVDPLVALRHD